ncbi:MAG: hypothetical protein M0R77_21070 [Gammaproteobacteria bacterium]|nr:hypothetical protein [Gammaproteobacteria bacterium]
MAKRSTTNYLNNKDLVKEIHKSKMTYCYYEDPKFTDYDTIIDNPEILTNRDLFKKTMFVDFDSWIESLIETREKRLVKEYGETDPVVTKDDLVIRIMSFDHIPLDPNWPDDKMKKKLSDGYMKVNFPPFIHVIFDGDDVRTVLKSHHTQDGQFSTDHGRTTAKLGKMYYLLVEKIGQKSNWRNYSYLDDMKSSALLQLSMVGLQFNESRGTMLNPFAFLTTCVYNTFKRVLNTEKKDRDLRDDLLENSGQAPSMSRQITNELETSDQWHISNGHFREKNKPRRMMPQVADGKKGMFGKVKKEAEPNESETPSK